MTPSTRLVEGFEAGGGLGKRGFAQIHVYWALTEAEACRTEHRWRPVAGLQGAVLSDLALPRDFERVGALVREDDVAWVVVCGPDPERHHAAIARFADAGFSHLYVYQIGPDQEGFFRFYEREVLPSFASSSDEEVPTWIPTPNMSTRSAARTAAAG